MMMSWQLGTQLLRKKQKKCHNKTPKNRKSGNEKKAAAGNFFGNP